MEVILKQDIPGQGKAGAVVKVKDGFAQNFLFPKGLALPSTPANLKKLEAERKRREAEQAKLKQEAMKLKERLEGKSFTIPVLTQEDEKLYAAIHAQEICRTLKDEGFDLDKNLIALDEPIKALGIFEVLVKVHPEVSAKIKIWVVKK